MEADNKHQSHRCVEKASLTGLAAALYLDNNVQLTENHTHNTETYCFHHKQIGALGRLSVKKHTTRACELTTSVASHKSASVQSHARCIFNPLARRARDLLSKQRNALQAMPFAHDLSDLPWSLQSLNCFTCNIRIALFAQAGNASSENEFELISRPLEAFFVQSKLPVWIVSEETGVDNAPTNNVWIKIARLNHGGRAHLVSIDNICRMISAKQKSHCMPVTESLSALRNPS